MGKIKNAFTNGKAFIGYVTGGDPDLNKTAEYVLAAAEAGAGIIEIGIPFSDPIADGEVIQRASLRALKGGATVDGILECVKNIRQKTAVPIVLMTYLNPVFRRGYREFFAECKGAGADGIIIPDLPFEESPPVRAAARAGGIDLISLVAPTSNERIAAIAKNSDGFLYIVSSMGVTGGSASITADLKATVAAVRAASDIPAAIGFGISTPDQARAAAALADGVIVGSAIVSVIERDPLNAPGAIREFVRNMKAAIE
ncbi:MAG: tryptophan synthase subunit alpha [Clostridiales bacterium]|jgi:tryptophan synthase alpha chain|nr:tryptophan synthase subunit alpha [Clostridiales bacterium]